jgi:hypothetical protein
LSRPLLDAVFAEQPGTAINKPILIALHSADSFLVPDKNKNGSILMSYHWNGFGFTGIKEKHLQMNADRISLAKDKIRLINSKNVIIDEVSLSELL